MALSDSRYRLSVSGISIRNTIPNRVRIIIQLVIVALFVILIDQFLKAYAYDE